jgi:hypothetical protein
VCVCVKKGVAIIAAKKHEAYYEITLRVICYYDCLFFDNDKVIYEEKGV